MNSDIIEGNLKTLKGDIQKHWSKLTDNHLTNMKGSRDKLAEMIQKNYGIAFEQAEKQVTDWYLLRAKITDRLSGKDSK